MLRGRYKIPIRGNFAAAPLVAARAGGEPAGAAMDGGRPGPALRAPLLVVSPRCTPARLPLRYGHFTVLIWREVASLLTRLR